MGSSQSVEQAAPAEQQVPVTLPEQHLVQEQQATGSVRNSLSSVNSIQFPQRQRRSSARAPAHMPWGHGSQSLATQNFQDDDELPPSSVAMASASAEPDPDVCQDGPLTLSTRVEYSAMPKDAVQRVFGLVTVQAGAAAGAAAATSERKPMDIVCVLDVSGSMGSQNKIEDLKAAVRFIVGEALPKDRLSLVTFNSGAERQLRLRRMDREGQDEATVATLRMRAGGGTRIAHGLDLGLQVLEQRRQRNKVSAILLLTDGQDGSCRSQLPQLLQRAGKLGCGIYAFGFGRDHDSELLREIGEQARTPFTYVEETALVREAFAGVVGGLSSVVAQQVQLSLRCQVQLKEVNTPFQVQREGESVATVTIPDIFAEERRDILVELSVPSGAGPASGSFALLEASARYVAVGEQEVLMQTPAVTMTVDRVDEPQPEQEPDAEVADQRERWEVTRVLEEASKQSDEGHFEAAQQLLRNKRQALPKNRPVTEALSLELEDAEQRMANTMTWSTGAHEVKDATVMHQMQRCTNMFDNKSGIAKKSKGLYARTTQREWISKTAPSGAASSSAP